LGWEGVAMMEYKWIEESNEFFFIEMNARYWGYLHLDLFTGVDYPAIQLDHFMGHQTTPPVQQQGVVCRHTVPGELGYVLSRIRDQSVSLSSKLWAAIEFVILFFNPFFRSDLLFPGDRKLYWLQWKQFLILLFHTK
jgi:biotin carboxylase